MPSNASVSTNAPSNSVATKQTAGRLARPPSHSIGSKKEPDHCAEKTADLVGNCGERPRYCVGNATDQERERQRGPDDHPDFFSNAVPSIIYCRHGHLPHKSYIAALRLSKSNSRTSLGKSGHVPAGGAAHPRSTITSKFGGRHRTLKPVMPIAMP